MRAGQLLATLTIDPTSLEIVQRLRGRYFPHAKTPAHITLFRYLPDEAVDPLTSVVEETAAFSIHISTPQGLETGVALPVQADALIALRAKMADALEDRLHPKDRRAFRPHITLQSRVPRRRAQRTLGAVRARFDPVDADALGVTLWQYKTGPWALSKALTFRPS